eukprot:gb/GEZN01005090.1/.p1 GENE.gb/GEZN01005090.1/~~gb/GEZN01005090.1/.p1  ORF type:complete len:532 (-),score=44.47 gb/GEZN01005090.1/:191-1786(-)
MVARLGLRVRGNFFGRLLYRSPLVSRRFNSTPSRAFRNIGRITMMSSPFFLPDDVPSSGSSDDDEIEDRSSQRSSPQCPPEWPLFRSPGLNTIFFLMQWNASQLERTDEFQPFKTGSSPVDNESLFKDLRKLLPFRKENEKSADVAESSTNVDEESKNCPRASPSSVSIPIPIKHQQQPESGSRSADFSPDLSFSPDIGDSSLPDQDKQNFELNDKDFAYFVSKVDGDGRLVLHDEDIEGEEGWKSLGFFLAACPMVRTLRLQGMEISKTQAMQLGQGGLKHIRSITLHGNNLGFNEDALEIIVGMLLLSDYLEDAQINRNCISDRHLELILRLLDKHSLKNLSLAWNGITDRGARTIADKLRFLESRRSSLAYLDLSHNMIDKRGLRELRSSQLHRHKQHHKFRLNWHRNKFSPPASWTVGSPYRKYVTPPRSPPTFSPSSTCVLPPSLSSKQYSPPTRSAFTTPFYAYNPQWGSGLGGATLLPSSLHRLHNFSPSLSPVGSPPSHPATPISRSPLREWEKDMQNRSGLE